MLAYVSSVGLERKMAARPCIRAVLWACKSTRENLSMKSRSNHIGLLSVCLSVRPTVRPSVRPSVYLSVCLSYSRDLAFMRGARLQELKDGPNRTP